MLFIITFFLIFGWKITSLLDISAIVASILTTQYVFCHKGWKEAAKNSSVIALTILSIYSIVLVLSTGITDIQPILRAIRALIMLLGSFNLYNLYVKYYRKPIYKLSTHIFISILLHSLLIIAMYSYAPLRLSVYTITNASDYVNPNSPYLDGYKICGLTYGLAQTSVLQIFGLLLIPLIYKKLKNYTSKFLIILSFAIIFISSLICGRTGPFLCIFLLPLYIILKIICFKFDYKKILNSLKILICFSFLIVLLTTIAYFILPKKFRTDRVINSLEIIDVFKNKSKTLKDIIKMYFLPQSMYTTLFGMGNYGRTKTFYLESDVGWIKSIFAVGFVGTLFMLYPLLWAIYKSTINIHILKEFAIAIILISLSTLVLNCKELALLTRNQWTIQALFIVVLSKLNKKDIIKI